jgi:UDP-glucose 4-epimerase
LVAAFERATQTTLKVRVAERRPGDVAGAYASSDKAQQLLGWSARYSLEEAISSAVAWSRIERDRLSS